MSQLANLRTSLRIPPAAIRLTATVVGFVGYIVLIQLAPSEHIFEYMMAAAAPSVVAAWAYGKRGAFGATAAIALINLVLVVGVRRQSLVAAWDAAAPIELALSLLVGVLIGRLRTIGRRLEADRRTLLKTQEVTIFALAYQAELRDFATGRHLERTALYVELLARRMAKLPSYRDYLTPGYVGDLTRAAPLHDIGKVGIPDAVLLKPDKLTDAEFDIMKEHCVLGQKVLTMAAERLGFQSFLEIAIQITGGHHERWDGSGYPRQIAEGRIPVSARIMALADAYDAMRSERVYKPALPHEQVIGKILLQRGRQFDPDVVDSFVAIEHEFHRLSVEMADPLEQDLELLQTA